jgi:hypothetical protein
MNDHEKNEEEGDKERGEKKRKPTPSFQFLDLPSRDAYT